MIGDAASAAPDQGPGNHGGGGGYAGGTRGGGTKAGPSDVPCTNLDPIPRRLWRLSVDQHANTSAASIPLALATGVEDGRIKRGDLVLMEAMGGGFTWGSALVRM